MKVRIVPALLWFLNSKGVDAFCSQESATRRQKYAAATATTQLFSRPKTTGVVDSLIKDATKAGASFFAAATIFSGALFSDMAVMPTPAQALELSRGAFVIETSKGGGQSLLKAEIDSKSIIKTLFVNRKDLAVSLNNIQSAVQNELATPVWSEIRKEILNLETDVVPEVKITPPSNIKAAIDDLSQGKINFLVNGEIVNVSIEPNFSSAEDDLIIRINGFKGEPLPSWLNREEEEAIATNYYGPIRSYISQFKEFWSFWDAPYPSKYLPGEMEASNGQILLAGTAGTIGLVYASAYGYHQNQIEEEERAAEEKRAKMAKKKGKQQKLEKEVKDNENRVVVAGYKSNEKEQAAEVEEDKPKAKKRRRFRFWKKD